MQATLQNGLIAVSPLLEGNGTATDVVTGQTVTLNLQDPDSMTLDPLGNIFMTSQADAELVLVRKPGTPEQTALQIPLTSPWGPAQADDTIFTPADDGVILVADTPANVVYEFTRMNLHLTWLTPPPMTLPELQASWAGSILPSGCLHPS